MLMHSLPPEILKSIVNEVSRVSDSVEMTKECLKALRLVNKVFSELAAPPLFRSIDVWVGKENLEALTAVSEHPAL